MQIISREVPMKGIKPLINFSPCGYYFIIFMKKMNVLEIYKINEDGKDGVYELLDKLQYGEEPVAVIKKNQALKGNKKLIWTQDSKYLACYGFEKLSIINIGDDQYEVGEIIYNFEIQKNVYRALIGAHIATWYDENDYCTFRCEVACLVNNQNNIRIFNCQEQNTSNHDKSRAITFINEDLKKLDLCISDDFTKVMYGNLQENYLLSEIENDLGYKEYKMTSIAKLQQKFVRKIVNAGDSEFLIICSA